MIGRESLKGYILEEIIAYLIRNTGYNLLVDPVQDQTELIKKGNGLVVKGRGAVHQADVLGQLAWIPAFTFPIRLFVEAKCRNVKTGLPQVRNAVGILEDINQNYSPVSEGKVKIQRFSYCYALFSTSGFTSTAADMALAHQISLIDLSGPNFRDLRDLLDEVAAMLLEDLNLKLDNLDEIQTLRDEYTNQRKPSKSIIQLFRLHIRRLLDTWPLKQILPLNGHEYNYLQKKLPTLESISNVILTKVNTYKEFFVGMANSPFLLTFKADNPDDFLRYARENPVHEVKINWSRRDNKERQWIIRPINNQQAYSLSFGLPQTIGDWIFGDDEEVLSRARDVKEKIFSDITIYRFIDGKDQLIRLKYDTQDTKEK